MPTFLTTTSFTVNFNLSSSPQQIQVTDTSDYAGNGVALADVIGLVAVQGPDGTIYYNNTNPLLPDINGSISLTNTTQIPFQYLPDGSIAPGVYTITLTTQITGNTPFTIVTQNTYNYTFVAPKISITQTVDCLTPRFTSADTTNYVVNGVTPTIVRNHVVYYASQPISSTSGTGATVILNSGQFYQGLQQTVITSTLTYNFGANQIVTVTITGTKTISVDCTYFCAIYCCLRSINSNIKKYKGVNDMLANEYEAIFVKVMGLVELATLAYSCGKANDVSGYVAQIQALADCTDDCGCTDGAASPVTGLGGAGSPINIQIQQCANNSITVTQSGVSPNITYTLCLAPALYSKILGLQNTIVTAGSGISVTPSGPTLIGGIPTMTYAVANTLVLEDRLTFECSLNYSGGTCSASITKAQVQGSLLQVPTSIYNTNVVPLNPNFPNTNNSFAFEGFFGLPPGANNYKVLGNIVGLGPAKKFANSGILLKTNSLSIASSGKVIFSLVDTFGNVIPSDASFITGANIIVNFEIITY